MRRPSSIPFFSPPRRIDHIEYLASFSNLCIANNLFKLYNLRVLLAAAPLIGPWGQRPQKPRTVRASNKNHPSSEGHISAECEPSTTSVHHWRKSDQDKCVYHPQTHYAPGSIARIGSLCSPLDVASKSGIRRIHLGSHGLLDSTCRLSRP